MSVYSSVNLESLGCALIKEIKNHWQNPFESPVVIFSDSKTEQWFKLFWLRNADENTSVLMNLKTERLEGFLNKIILSEDKSIKPLDGELLTQAIISCLASKDKNGTIFYKTLKSPEVEAYLQQDSKNGGLNLLRLYDFAREMSNLFITYETTRNSTFLEGKGWQELLYKEIIGKGINIGGTKYCTLSQLVEINKKQNNGEVHFNYSGSNPVYLFGFSGIGQFYRTLLTEFAKHHTLNVFIQAPPVRENEQNLFIKKWAGYGLEHKQLWSDNTHLVESEYNADSMLHKIQKDIMEGNKVSEYENDNSITFTAVPSKIREVEIVHSRICKLLNEGKADLSEILVLSPNLKDYKVAIMQIFNQIEKDDQEYPYIPYTITDYSSENSLVAEAVGLLTGIVNKGYLSRSDFFALLRNSIVQNVRNISDEDVSVWSNWISEMRVFRDRGTGETLVEDWEKAKKRILLSRFTENTVCVDSKEYLPFSDLNTEDNNLLYKFISAIDNLKKWIEITNKSQYQLEDINQIQICLDSWLLQKSNTEDFAESYVYQSVTEEITLQKKLFAYENTQFIWKECFFLSISDSACGSTLSNGKVFTNGISFVNFKANRILPARYVFIMGLDSKHFPGTDSNNVLDLRGTERLPGDDSIPGKNKNAFFCQLMSAKDGLYLSYVNKDLQKDEDFYKASVLTDLISVVISSSPEEFISIDENRSWDDLFTPREFRNKGNYLNLKKETQEQDKKIKKEMVLDLELPDRVSISNIKKFLADPFSFYIESMFSKENDESQQENEELEPVDFDSITSTVFQKEYIIQKSKNEWNLNNFIQDKKRNNSIPDDFFGTLACKEMIQEADKKYAAISSEFDINNMELEESINLSVANPEKEWHLTGISSWHTKNFSKLNVLTVFDFSSNYLTAYISSLALMAGLGADIKKEIAIKVCCLEKQKDGEYKIKSVGYKISPEEANECLRDIYNAMYIEHYTKCVPLTYIEEDTASKETRSFSSYRYNLIKEYGAAPWKYFSKAGLFDTETEIGFTEEDFVNEWPDAVEHQKKFIKYL